MKKEIKNIQIKLEGENLLLKAELEDYKSKLISKEEEDSAYIRQLKEVADLNEEIQKELILKSSSNS